MRSPNRHKMALITWSVVYPLITVLLMVLEPLLAGLPVPLRTLILTLILVPLMGYVAMPAATRLLRDWIAN